MRYYIYLSQTFIKPNYHVVNISRKVLTDTGQKQTKDMGLKYCDDDNAVIREYPVTCDRMVKTVERTLQEISVSKLHSTFVCIFQQKNGS